jgi:hypothetical protein
MRGTPKNRGRWSGVVSVLCLVMMLAMGTVQAVHVHPDNAPRHTCSICSTPNAKLNTEDASPVPVMVAVPVASVEISVPRIFRPTTPNFVRPPPAA